MKTPISKWSRILCCSVLLVTACSSMVILADDSVYQPWDAPARAARRKNPIASDAKSIAAGKDVYTAQCLKCHGDAGKGDGQSAKDLTPKPRDLSNPKIASQTDGSIFWKLTTGRKPMPTFETLISEDDRWNAINYVRTLEPAPTTKPSSAQ
jgi:mono/diheme cytochrome c family protein